MKLIIWLAVLFCGFIYFTHPQSNRLHAFIFQHVNTLKFKHFIDEKLNIVTGESDRQRMLEEAIKSKKYQCDGRIHCSEMTSCEEALFFAHQCPNAQMDGDGDGVPCERQWCN